MGLLDWFRHKKEVETSRVERLLSAGRIVEGRILDLTPDNDNACSRIFYTYSVHGVEYESSQSLNAQQQDRIAKYAPGSRVTIRYDQRQPANSIVV